MNEYKTIFQNPPLNTIDNTYYIDNYNNFILSQGVKDQYENLDQLGINFIDQKTISDDIYIELLMYVHENYFPIMNIEMIFETPKLLPIIGSYVYHFICLDLINIILPKCLMYFDIEDPQELYSVSSDALILTILQNIVIPKIEMLKILNTKKSDIAMYNELLKWTFYVDILDNDCQFLCEKLIFPIVGKYEMDILCKNT